MLNLRRMDNVVNILQKKTRQGLAVAAHRNASHVTGILIVNL